MVCCQSGKRTFFTMSSMSATMRSTMMWVFLLFGFVEQFGEGFLGPVAFLLGIGLLLGFDDFLGEFEDLLQELQAGEEALLVALLDLLQPLAQRDELGIAEVLAQPGDELDLDLPCPSSPGRRPSGCPPAPGRPAPASRRRRARIRRGRSG